MSLYLAVFDDNDEELDGFQVGTYHDYGRFIDTIVSKVEGDVKASRCPILVCHHDSDGFWSTEECKVLISELALAKTKLKKLPAEKIDFDWKKRINFEEEGLAQNLHESLTNVDGEPIVEALLSLCKLAVKNNARIYFQ